MTDRHPSRPQVCFCSIAFRQERIEDIIPRLAEAGYDGIEVWGGHLDGKSDAELDAIRDLATRHGIALPVLAPYFWLTRDLPELVARSLATAERFTAYARRLGASRIRTFVDAGNDGIGSAVATPEHWARAVGCLKTITALAPDLLFVVETHADTLADTPESMERLMREVGAANLVVNYQTGAFDPLPGYRRLKPAVRHFHLMGAYGSPAGGYLEETGAALLPLLAELRADGYAGTMSVEYCWGGVAWPRAQAARAWLASHGC